jgi:hypothetical protein
MVHRGLAVTSTPALVRRLRRYLVGPTFSATARGRAQVASPATVTPRPYRHPMSERATHIHGGWIGWCHSCETLQLGDDARWLRMPWNPGGEPMWACVNCDDEPWALGVWNIACPACVDAGQADHDLGRARARTLVDINNPAETVEHRCERMTHPDDPTWEPQGRRGKRRPKPEWHRSGTDNDEDRFPFVYENQSTGGRLTCTQIRELTNEKNRKKTKK